jgi:hypothetical protein
VHCESSAAVAVTQGQFGERRKGSVTLEAGTRGVGKDSRLVNLNSELSSVRICDSASKL